MGITIESYPVYDGAATLKNVYVNVRDFETTKERLNNQSNENIYKFKFIVNYFFDNKSINMNLISKQSDTPYTQNLWDLAYTEIKAILDSENLTYSDDV